MFLAQTEDPQKSADCTILIAQFADCAIQTVEPQATTNPLEDSL